MMGVTGYLRLRLRLLGRLLRELGWWRLFLLGGLLLAASGKALGTAAASAYGQWAVPVGWLLLVGSAHRRRTDMDFLRLAAPAFRWWLAAEYALSALPVAIGLLLFKQFDAVPLLGLLPPLAAWLPTSTARPVRSRSRSGFRSEAFEWVSGFRGGGGWVVWVGLCAMAIWQHAQPVLPALALVAWALYCTSFYGTPEPLPWLLLAARSPGSYLRRRWALGAAYFLLLALPLVYCLALGDAGWPGALAVLNWGLLVLTLVGLAKYAFYPNPLLMQLTQGGVVALAFLLFVNAPIYAALIMAVFWGGVLKSRRRLATYRYD